MSNDMANEHDDGVVHVNPVVADSWRNHLPQPPITTPRQQDAMVLICFAMECGEKGFTCDEWEVKSGKLHQSASARVFDLAAAKVILLTRDKRMTRCKRKAGVYRVDPEIGSEKEAYSRFLKWTSSAPRGRSGGENAVLEAAREYVKAYRTIGASAESQDDALDNLQKIILKVLV
jgi:hypothetical protein